MRQSIALLFLVFVFVLGCGTSSKPDTDAARQFVRKSYANADTLVYDLVESPEYATIAKIPRDHIASGFPDRSAACGVRIQFTWRNGGSTTHDDCVVWVSS